MSEIAVLRALKLGDMLCAVPAFRALRQARPGDRITLIGLPWAAGLVTRFPSLIDGFLEFPGWPGMPEREVDPRAIDAFLADALARHFELAIQMHGSGVVSNEVVASLGATTTAGFTAPGAAALDVAFPYPDELHEVHRHLALLEHLGIANVGDELSFPTTDGDREEVAALGLGAGDGYAVVHPGAISGRRWSPGRFATVVDLLSGDMPVVLTGNDAERAISAAVASRASSPVTHLAGMTSLGALAALLDGARIVVTNDTGVSHLAAAVATPSVVLFLSSDPRRWAPRDTSRHRAVVHPAIARALAAHPERSGALEERCFTDGCERHPVVLDADPDAIAIEVVTEEIRALLASSPAIR